MATVLFVCVHNAGRSQMAEAFFNKLAEGRHKATSAGSQPADKVNPLVVKAMKEKGIDIGRRKPKKLDADAIEAADLAVTMGCGPDVCPVITGEIREWDIPDPSGEPLPKVREIRDKIETRVEALVKELDRKKPSG